MPTLSLRLPCELTDKLNGYARQCEMTASQWANGACREWLAAHPTPASGVVIEPPHVATTRENSDVVKLQMDGPVCLQSPAYVRGCIAWRVALADSRQPQFTIKRNKRGQITEVEAERKAK